MRLIVALRPIVVAIALTAGPVAISASVLQVDKTIRMPSTKGAILRFSEKIEGGGARIYWTIRNSADGDTVQIDVNFDYQVPPGSIWFDEIINRVAVAVTESTGRPTGRIVLNVGALNLNPNRSKLSFRGTAYRPSSNPDGYYTVRLKLFGNYE